MRTERDRIKHYLLKGKNYAYIADKLNVSREWIRRRIKHLSLLPEAKVSATIQESKKKRKEQIRRKTHFDSYGYYPGERDSISPLFRKKFYSKKTNARRNGVPFSLKLSDIDFPKVCPVLGIRLNYRSTVVSDRSPSFDRHNPKKGYVKGNVFIISQRANRIKCNSTLPELKRICLYLSQT